MSTTAAPDAIAREGAMDLLQVDDRLQEEMRRLAAINQELLGNARPERSGALGLPGETDELTALRADNAALRARVEELEQALQAAAPAGTPWAEQQKDYEALLEEKSEVIRSLHLKVQQLQEGGGASAPAAPAASAASAALAADTSEIDPLKKQMADQRRQLEEDEQALMQQMRQMEMAMSKDRAELARQRNEIQRLHNELNREIENASRDPGLRERLTALQRLQGEISGRKPAAGAAPAAKPAAKAPAAKAPVANTTAPPEPDKKSGLFRRIFGK
jgi:DNA repair exonuclease SbcCD ATPase subunit